MDVKTIKELLENQQAKPSKGLGQNFLIDASVLEKIITAANLSNDDTVLEIGPGMGVLTKELAKKAKRVVAIEKDSAMVAVLQETLKEFSNVEIINGDALAVNLESANFVDRNFKVVANIPYYITSPLIRKLLESSIQPSTILLMVQKEVAQRICAKTPDMNLLAVCVQCYAAPKILFSVPKGAFWPAPKIDSAVIQITPSPEKLPVNTETFFAVVKAGFSQPRKQLINNFSTGLNKTKEEVEAWLLHCNIKPTQRAQTLSIADWVNLAQNF